MIARRCITRPVMTDVLSALRARRKEIARSIELLRSEDEQLAQTEDVLTRLNSAAVRGVSEDRAAFYSAPASRPTSQREAVLAVLSSSARAWLKSGEIAAQAQALWGMAIPELSLRPLLSNMRDSGEIVRRGRLIALKTRASEAKCTRE